MQRLFTLGSRALRGQSRAVVGGNCAKSLKRLVLRERIELSTSPLPMANAYVVQH